MRRALAAALGLGALSLAACGSFDDPAIVLDLRILAMTAEPPEQVQPFDPDNPLATQFGPVEVCALVADPAATRGVSWTMTACPPVGGRRCSEERPAVAMGSGHLDDPELAGAPQVACATLPADASLVALLRDTIEHDSVSGFAGIDLNISLQVIPDGAGEDAAVYGTKSARYSPLLPADRVANTNPHLDQIAVDRGDPAAATPLPLGRCIDQAAPLTLGPRETLHFLPVEPDGVREDYVLPTFEGGSRMFTENLTYQWLAGRGDWTRGNTGGTRDSAGNQPPLDTEWESPGDLDGPTDVPLWIMQRDERGGGIWYESCVRVTP